MPQTYRDDVATPPVKQHPDTDIVLDKINSGKLWIVNSRRRNGIVVYKKFHAEFAGPGAAVGGALDEKCESISALGNLSLVEPKSYEDQQKAIRIRLQWVRLTQNFTDKPIPVERAQMILEQFKTYFDQSIVDSVPDEAFSLLVGVFPSTVRKARRQ
ncbi:MAG: hypothetical protein F6K00_11890 [Leptolyngbya sp. SIOISBB]|nr:hypothetical protein [Leptolyngbya sp. SIOISBB]